MNQIQLATVLLVSAVPLARGGTSWSEVFSTDFDSGLTSNITGAGGLERVPAVMVGLGHGSGPFSGDLYRNATAGNPAASTVLTISNLPTHDALRLSFLLVFIDSWDSTNGSVAPDYFNVVVDGTVVVQTTSNNITGSDSYSGDLIYNGNAGWASYIDRAFDMSGDPAFDEIAHTADSVTIELYASGGGWQGGADESWAIDNLRVSALVPAPSALACTGLALLAAGRRRR